MCVDPASLVLMSTVLSAVGTVTSGIATSQAQQAAATQDRINAERAQMNAEATREEGNIAQQELQLKKRAMIGEQINVLSERNLDVGSGSALDILGDTAMFGKLDELTTRRNYAVRAQNFENQAADFQRSSDLNANASRMTQFGIGLDLLGTGVKGYSDYRKITL